METTKRQFKALLQKACKVMSDNYTMHISIRSSNFNQGTMGFEFRIIHNPENVGVQDKETIVTEEMVYDFHDYATNVDKLNRCFMAVERLGGKAKFIENNK